MSDNGPININTKNNENYTDCDNGCVLKFFYNYSNITLKNKAGQLYLLFDKNNYVSYNNSVYYLKYGTFTSKSSHRLNKKKSDLELYLFHEKFVNNKDKLIISILIKENNVSYEKNNFFKHFDNIPYPSENKSILLFDYKKKLNVFDILPKSKQFYEYGYSNNKNKTINIVFKKKINLNEYTISNIKQFINLEPRKYNNKFNENINYSNRTVIKNNYDSANIVTNESLRDICVDVYKDKPKDFNNGENSFNAYYTLFKKIFYFNLAFLSILFILEVLGLLSLFKKIVDIPFKEIIKFETFFRDIQIKTQYIIIGIAFIILLYYIFKKPFEIDTNIDDSNLLSIEDKLRSASIQSTIDAKEDNAELNNQMYAVEENTDQDEEQKGMSEKASGTSQEKDDYMYNMF